MKNSITSLFAWSLALVAAGVLFAGSAADSHACSPGDVTIRKSGPHTANVGDTVTYVLEVEELFKKKNTGVHSITVLDNVPTGLEIQSVTLNPSDPFAWYKKGTGAHGTPQCSFNGQQVNCHLPRMSGSDNNPWIFDATVTIKAKVLSQAACSTIKNFATVSAKDDKNSSNNKSNVVMTQVGGCSTPTPTPTVTPKPTPTPKVTPTPTPTPTPEPTPEPGEPSIRVNKTDNRDITRPGHSLTYVIEVENTGDIDLHDVEIIDDVPSQLENIKNISHGGTYADGKITWKNVNLEIDQKKTFEFTATVKANTANGTILHNEVDACSDDHDVCDEDTDTTKVEKPAVVAGKTVKVVPVPVSAKTGAAGLLTAFSTLMGASGLAYVIRKGF